jgi:AraC-like DNA-binding protein
MPTVIPRMVRSAALGDYAEVARSLGLEPHRMLEIVGLPAACLRDPEAKIPVETAIRLAEQTAAAAGVDDIGVRLAETHSLSNLGPIALIIRDQPTIRDAMRIAGNYIKLHNEALSLSIEEHDDVVILSPTLLVGRSLPTRDGVELSVGALYRILRSLVGHGRTPLTVHLARGIPRDRTVYDRLFGPRLHFNSDFNGIVLAKSDFEGAIPTSDPTLARYAQQYVDSLAVSNRASVTSKVSEIVCAMLPGGCCTMDEVAARLTVDRRTLHRHLMREKTTFSEIVDSVRAEMAILYVKDAERPLYVVAELLGFSAHSGFSRWFRNRFGCSVSDWRLNGPKNVR